MFNARDPNTLPLNSTLTLPCEDTDVEGLKECLFKDPFESFFAYEEEEERDIPPIKTNIFAANANMSYANILMITPI